jgi:hypothetical protein
MAEAKQFAVIQLPELRWPSSLPLSSRRFRLFVAADISDVSVDAVSDFASAALSKGMVYFCAWGRDCERFHDIVDEVIVKDDLGERKFVGPTASDTVMTTWHDHESLEEALDFFATCAIPTDGLTVDSAFRLVICVGKQDWAEIAKRFLQSAELLI